MTTKFLGRTIAGAALGGAALLIGAPGMALADDGGQHENRIFTKPAVTTPGKKVEIIQKCTEPQKNPKAWSEVTGKVELALVRPPHKPDEQPERQGSQGDQRGNYGDQRGDYGDQRGDYGERQDSQGAGGMDDRGREERKKHMKVFVYAGEARVHKNAHPGTYELKGSCAEGEIVVAPRGHIEGGDGGSASNTGLAAGGAGMLAAATIGGMIVLRRRQTNGTLA